MLFGVWVSSDCVQGVVLQDAVWGMGVVRLCTGGSLAGCCLGYGSPGLCTVGSLARWCLGYGSHPAVYKG